MKIIGDLSKRGLIIKGLCTSAVLLSVVFIWKIFVPEKSVHNFPDTPYISDEVGLFSLYHKLRFNQYLKLIFEESDIDIHFVFLKDTGDKTIEEVAIEKMQQLRIGGQSREERGVLLLYDLSNKNLRIEVGFGLEEYFPDGFVGYLIHDHTHAFFSAGDFQKGLLLLVRMLHRRIREQVLGRNFDPRVVEIIRQRECLSGGAGVTAVMAKKGQKKSSWLPRGYDEEFEKYTAQPTPEEAYKKFLVWFASQRYNPNIDLFTPDSQEHMSRFPMTKAYCHYMLMHEFGKKYKIEVKDNLALLYFTDDPMVCPHFFIKTHKGWQMDLMAELRNTQNIVGGVYTWNYTGRDDIYTKAFSEKFINIKNYIRIIDGDNREIPIRASA